MTEWANDFSFSYLSQIYEAIRKNHSVCLIGDAEKEIQNLDQRISERKVTHKVPKNPQLDRPVSESANLANLRVAFIRHDIDVCLHRALEMAKFEKEIALQTTYHVMLENPFYKIKSSLDLVHQIHDMGHEVGLHYDGNARGMFDADPLTREKDISTACDELSSLIGQEVRSVSFHRPVPELLNGPLRVGGRISGYAAPLFKWYLSDSKARWREGEPLQSLHNPRSHILQILIHPIWWGKEHLTAGKRLREFLLVSKEKRNESFFALNNILDGHIAHRADEV